MEEHQRGFGEYELVPWSKKERGSGTAGKVLVKVVPNCSREECQRMVGKPMMVLYSTDTPIIGSIIARMNLCVKSLRNGVWVNLMA